MSLSRQSLALSSIAAVSVREGWACLQFSCAAKNAIREGLPEHSPFLSSPWAALLWLLDPAPHRFCLSRRSQGQTGWCWRRSPLLKKWKRNEQAAVRCPLVPHWLNPGCQKAAQEESHFKKQQREIKSSYSTITDSEIQVILCSHPQHKHTVFICPLWNFTEFTNSK